MGNDLKKLWAEKYKCVPTQLERIKEISVAATAFNTNIDAIVKISGNRLKTLLESSKMPVEMLTNIKQTQFDKPTDVLLGIVKCFSRGIAEEWVTEDEKIYKWIEKNLGYHHLQMGGQGGIIANTLALLGIKKVITHTNSHPKLQAEQFLDLENLFALDEHGDLKKATSISRSKDIPLIHWIIEFDKGDSFTYQGKSFTCPKSNRFIATYDPLNINLVMNEGFDKYMQNNPVEYLVLSGFHPLLSKNNGVELLKNAVPVIKNWQKANPKMITHLEIASTQDKVIRKNILKFIVPLAQSMGLNERETIDLLNVSGQKELAKKIEKETTSCHLFEALVFLKETLNIARIQLHMFGLYMTIQDKNFPYSAEQNLKGMMTASVVSSSKAFHGALEKYDDISLTKDYPPSDTGLKELTALAKMLKKPELAEIGVAEYKGYIISAIPTILIDKPKTLVGMGDTISSVSLLAGR